MALLIVSYSAVAISKSCSSCIIDLSGSSPYIQAKLTHLEQILFVAQRLFLLVAELGERIIDLIVIRELHTPKTSKHDHSRPRRKKTRTL